MFHPDPVSKLLFLSGKFMTKLVLVVLFLCDFKFHFGSVFKTVNLE
jgi:hypothetical protein